MIQPLASTCLGDTDVCIMITSCLLAECWIIFHPICDETQSLKMFRTQSDCGVGETSRSHHETFAAGADNDPDLDS